MKTIEQIRQENLRAVIDRFYDETARRFALAYGIAENSMSRFFKPKGHKDFRPINDSMRRWIETTHQLDAGWMDKDHSIESDPLLKEVVNDLKGLSEDDQEAAKKMFRDIVARFVERQDNV